MGDPAGIGGELILKAVGGLTRSSIPVVIGDLSLMKRLASRLNKCRTPAFRPFKEASSGEAEVVDASSMEDVRFGRSDASCGRASYGYIVEALKLLFSGEVAAVVTCPINKKSIQAAGAPFVGHTELFAHYAGVTDYVMMMTAGRLRVSLATIHVAESGSGTHNSGEGLQDHRRYGPFAESRLCHPCALSKGVWRQPSRRRAGGDGDGRGRGERGHREG